MSTTKDAPMPTGPDILDTARTILAQPSTELPWKVADGKPRPGAVVAYTGETADGNMHVVVGTGGRRGTPAEDAVAIVAAVNGAPALAEFVLLVDEVTRKAVADNAEFDGTEYPEAEYLACALDIRRRLGLSTEGSGA